MGSEERRDRGEVREVVLILRGEAEGGGEGGELQEVRGGAAGEGDLLEVEGSQYVRLDNWSLSSVTLYSHLMVSRGTWTYIIDEDHISDWSLSVVIVILVSR